MSGGAERVLTGRHVLWALLGFFALVSAVNAAMVWLALDSFPGRTSDDPYREGLAYNRVLETRAAQRALGWRAEVRFEAAPGGGALLSASFRDRDGRPLAGLAVRGTLSRPATAGFDRPVRLAETGAGLYTARLSALNGKGWWLLALEARGGGAVHGGEYRLWLD